MFVVEESRFRQLVARALDSLPQVLGEVMDNVVVVVEDAHPEEGLMGLYEGIPLTERMDYGGLTMPDRITLYRLAICAACDTESELLEEIAVTVIHEVGHHFGLDDHTLDRLGWS